MCFYIFIINPRVKIMLKYNMTFRQKTTSNSKYSTIRQKTPPKTSRLLIKSNIQQISIKCFSSHSALLKKSISAIQNAQYQDQILKEKANLAKVLNNYHSVLNKIQYTICLKIVLNSFFRKYKVNQLIPLNNLSIGFLIYGKVLLKNEESGFQTILKDEQVINQQLVVSQKYGIPTLNNPKLYVLYDAIAVSDCMIIWLETSAVQEIRSKCFKDFDLKAKYHKFQTILKVLMIAKKLKTDKSKQF